MTRFRRGDIVEIPCKVQPGAFLTERLVTIQSMSGTISGFVPSENLSNVRGDQGYMSGIVRDVGPDKVMVEITGSFFTTTGLAELELGWAASNLRSA